MPAVLTQQVAVSEAFTAPALSTSSWPGHCPNSPCHGSGWPSEKQFQEDTTSASSLIRAVKSSKHICNFPKYPNLCVSNEERIWKETDLKHWCLHCFVEPDGKCNKFVYDTAPGEAMRWVQVGAGGFAVMQRECGFGRRGQPAFFFFKMKGKIHLSKKRTWVMNK